MKNKAIYSLVRITLCGFAENETKGFPLVAALNPGVIPLLSYWFVAHLCASKPQLLRARAVVCLRLNPSRSSIIPD